MKDEFTTTHYIEEIKNEVKEKKEKLKNNSDKYIRNEEEIIDTLRLFQELFSKIPEYKNREGLTRSELIVKAGFWSDDLIELKEKYRLFRWKGPEDILFGYLYCRKELLSILQYLGVIQDETIEIIDDIRYLTNYAILIKKYIGSLFSEDEMGLFACAGYLDSFYEIDHDIKCFQPDWGDYSPLENMRRNRSELIQLCMEQAEKVSDKKLKDQFIRAVDRLAKPIPTVEFDPENDSDVDNITKLNWKIIGMNSHDLEDLRLLALGMEYRTPYQTYKEKIMGREDKDKTWFKETVNIFGIKQKTNDCAVKKSISGYKVINKKNVFCEVDSKRKAYVALILTEASAKNSSITTK